MGKCAVMQEALFHSFSPISVGLRIT